MHNQLHLLSRIVQRYIQVGEMYVDFFNRFKERRKVNTMEKMQELYDKVAKDEALQEKFNEIMNGVEGADQEEVAAKLVAFAKESGYDVTPEEIQAFFKSLAENQNGSLSDAELDMVAGGKSKDGSWSIFCSVFSLGIGCAIISGIASTRGNDCGHYFE